MVYRSELGEKMTQKNDQAKVKIKGEQQKKLTGMQCGLTQGVRN